MIDLTLIALIVLYIGSIGYNVYAAKHFNKMMNRLMNKGERLEDRIQEHNSNVAQYKRNRDDLTWVINELGIHKEFNEALMRHRK